MHYTAQGVRLRGSTRLTTLLVHHGILQSNIEGRENGKENHIITTQAFLSNWLVILTNRNKVFLNTGNKWIILPKLNIRYIS